MKPKDDLSYEYVDSILEYNPYTGNLIWKVNKKSAKVKGKIAGRKANNGYIQIKIDGKSYMAHRLAYLLMTGIWPKYQIDHWDNNPSNNKWYNLRIATHSQNMSNTLESTRNTSGYRGVCWSKKAKKWHAKIQVNGEKIHLGYFDFKHKAAEAYNRAALEYFGEFATLNENIVEDPNDLIRIKKRPVGKLKFGSYQRNKTHCKHGHEFTPENTYIRPKGTRECRICIKKRGSKRKNKRNTIVPSMLDKLHQGAKIA
jgi:hypothetical protein